MEKIETTGKLGDTTQDDARSFTQLFSELPGRWVKDKLRDMPFCELETGYFIPLIDAATVRAVISDLFKGPVYQFQTKITDGGIIVYRKPDLEPEPTAN